MLNAGAASFTPGGAPAAPQPGAPPAATGFGSAAGAGASGIAKPVQPPPDAPPEQHEQFKRDLAAYLTALRNVNTNMAAENQRRQQQQQQRARPTYEVETVYVGDDGVEEPDEFYYEDEDGVMRSYGGGEEDWDGLGGGSDSFDQGGVSEEEGGVNEDDQRPASQFLGRALGPEELFRIAKMATRSAFNEENVMSDFFGVEAELVARTGFDLAGLRDSFNRTVVHFAAEGGSVQLCTELRTKLGDAVALARDDKQTQPWQVAVMCRHPECAAALMPPPDPQTGALPFGITTPDDLRSEALVSSLLQAFAPRNSAPPLAFGQRPPEFKKTHTVWGASNAALEQQSAAAAGALRTESIACDGQDVTSPDVLTAFDAICNGFGNPNRQGGGLRAAQWVAPLSVYDFASRRAFTHVVGAFEVASGAFTGAAVFSATGVLGGRQGMQLSAGSEVMVYVVSSAAVAASASAGGGDSGAVMHAIMRQANRDYQGSCVFLRTPVELPKAALGDPVARVKWMYRIVQPTRVLNQRAAAGAVGSSPCALRDLLCGDYDKYAATSMVDTSVRQAVGENHPVPRAELAAWKCFVGGPGTNSAEVTDAMADAIATLCNGCTSADAEYGVTWNAVIVKLLLQAADLRFCVRFSEQQQVADVIVFRMVEAAVEAAGASRTATPASAGGGAAAAGAAGAAGTDAAPIIGAIVTGVYAPTVARGRRALVAAAVAAATAGADVVFASNTFGLANADLTGAAFDDIPGSLERVYCLSSVNSASGAKPCMAPGGMWVPFL